MSNKPTRPTKQIVNARIDDVLRIRLDGAEFIDVREYAHEKQKETGSPWESSQPLSDGQIRRYIAAADKLIAESCRVSRARLLRRHLAQRRHLYGKANNQGDLRAALSCLESEARLLHLHEARSKPKPLPADAPAPTAADVVKAIAARIAEVETAKDLDVAERAKLTASLADALLRAIGADSLEERIATLEKVLAERERTKR